MPEAGGENKDLSTTSTLRSKFSLRASAAQGGPVRGHGRTRGVSFNDASELNEARVWVARRHTCVSMD